jgi:hypothetical protein
MFILHQIIGSNHPQSIEMVLAGNITPDVGMALYPSSGKMIAVSGTTGATKIPSYISLTKRAAALGADGALIPCLRVNDKMIFKTTFSTTATSINVGDKVTIASGGGSVTATTSSGVAEVVAKEGTGASGDTVYVRFPGA